jgi:hypothetical protein
MHSILHPKFLKSTTLDKVNNIHCCNPTKKKRKKKEKKNNTWTMYTIFIVAAKKKRKKKTTLGQCTIRYIKWGGGGGEGETEHAGGRHACLGEKTKSLR